MRSICQGGRVFAPGDYYQGSGLLEGWLRRGGAPPIKELKQKAEEGHRLWIFPIGKLTR
jgi:hypothetical protein